MEAINILKEDFKVLTKFFPPGWMAKVREMGAIKRLRNIKSINVLIQVLFIHLADGCSLRETVARAKQGKLANISDVALLKRLKSASKWFNWMSVELLKSKGICITPPEWLKNYRVKSVDASVITEPGSTGTDWRLHYCIDLFSLNCTEFKITRPDVGESFTNYKIGNGELYIGDRAYGRLKGLCYIKKNGGDFIARYKNKAFTILYQGKEFEMVKAFKGLKYGEIKEWKVQGATKNGLELPLRICVIKKSKEEAERSIKKAKRAASKGQRKVDPLTLELHRYVILLTSLPDKISTKLILELYRFRWQIEIAFKRLKSILGIGHLPKIDEESCRAWLHGKMLVALLAQSIVDEGRNFFPWGYPIR
jgi:hypothetical protein